MLRSALAGAVLALSLTTISCASSGSASAVETQSTSSRSTSASKSLSASDLEKSGAPNLYEAIRRLRPGWLNERPSGSIMQGNEPLVVYLDGTRYGQVRSLQMLNITGIAEVRRYDASEATYRWGTGHGNGAIEVKTRSNP